MLAVDCDLSRPASCQRGRLAQYMYDYMCAYSNAIVYLQYLLQNITNNQVMYMYLFIFTAYPMHPVAMVTIQRCVMLKKEPKSHGRSNIRDFWLQSHRMYILNTDEAKN